MTITGTNFEPSATSVTFNGIAAIVRTITATEITTTVPMAATTGPLVVTNSRGSASVTFTVTLTADFALTASPAPPATLRVIAGDQGFADVQASGSGNFTSLVSLSVSGAPAGVTTSFSPQFLAPGGSSFLGFTVAPTTPTGSYLFTISGQAQVDGQTQTRTADVVLEVLPQDTLAVTGRVWTAEAIPKPIPGVTVTLGTAFTLTDAGGNFVLLSPPTGPNMLVVDGRTASTVDAQYPPIEIQVDVAASGPTRVPFILYLPKLDTAHPITLSLDATGAVTQTVQATTPLIPGLVVTIPQGTRIIGPDGNPVSQITITPVPPDRTPMPFPPGVVAPMLFTIQPGGAVPSQPLPITFPNPIQAPPGTPAQLYFFDLIAGNWATWGTGAVSSDGLTIPSDPGFGLPRFAWHFPDCGLPGRQPHSRNPQSGDPIDLPTGRFIVSKTDLVLPGLIPVSIGRRHASDDPLSGRLGPAWHLDLYDAIINVPDFVRLTLQLPNQTSYTLTPAGPGQWVNTTEPFLRGAVLTQLPGNFNFELRFKDGTIHRFLQMAGFNSTAALNAIIDRNGNTVTVTREFVGFGQLDRIRRVTEPGGRSIELGYDTANRLTTVTDPLGRTVQYAYDAQGRLETVTGPAGGVTRYAYDAANQIASITDARGITFITNEYDADGRVVRQTQADGGVWTFAYTVTGGIVTATTVTDPRGQPTTYRFDSQSFMTSRTDALGQTTVFEYGPDSNLLLAQTDPSGRVTRFTYDAQGNVTGLTDPAGNTRAFTYEPTFNRVTSISDPLGNITGFEYDGAGNLTASVDPLGNRTTIAYNAVGQPTSTTDPLGNATTFTYDAVGNPATTTDPLGNITLREYDAASRLIAQTDPRGTITLFAYDPLNRLTRITEGVGADSAPTTLFQDTFDAENGGVATTNYTGLAQWTIARGCVDLIGNGFFDFFPGNGLYLDLDGSCFLAARIESQTAFSLVPGSYELAFSLAGSQRTQSPSDSVTVTLGEVFTETITLPHTAPLAPFTRTITVSAPTTAQLAFDHAGSDNIGLLLDAVRLTRTTGPTPDTVTQFAYDPNGNLLTVTDARGGVTSHTYDSMDRLATRTDPVGAVESFAYDGAGNIVQHTDRKGQVATFTHDALNRRTQASYADGSTTAFAYDAAGRLIAATDSVGGTIENTYDTLDRLIAQATGLGTVSYQYDAIGRRTEMTAPGQAPVAYGYDATSRLTAIIQGAQVITLGYDTAGRRTLLTLPNAVSTEYQYDAASRLTALIYRNATGVLGDLTYVYDPAGNRTRVDGSFARTLLSGPVASATYDAANRQLAFGDKSMMYDANGNLISLSEPSGIMSFAWDARNSLVSLNGPDQIASFTYDLLGRRITKEVNGEFIQFLYDGVDMIQELPLGAPVSYLRGLTLDEPWGRNGSEFYLADAVTSILALTDASGTLSTRYAYEPFGQTATEGVTSQNPFQYAGRENDGTALYYYRARYYAPQLGRFIAEDPLRPVNLYSYAADNPILATDPLGLRTAVISGGIGSSGPAPGGSGLSGESMASMANMLQIAGEPTQLFNANDTAAAYAYLQAGLANGEPVNIVCHSAGCGNTLSTVGGAGFPIDRLVTLDCVGGACGTVSNNVRTNLNIYQNGGIPGLSRGSPNTRPGGGGQGITNIDVTPQGLNHYQIPRTPAVRDAVRRCVTVGDCGGRGLGGRGLGGRK